MDKAVSSSSDRLWEDRKDVKASVLALGTGVGLWKVVCINGKISFNI